MRNGGVDADHLSDGEVETLRGRCRWNACAFVAHVICLVLVVDFVVKTCDHKNAEIEKNTTDASSTGHEAEKGDELITNPEERAKRAMICTSISVMFATALLWVLQSIKKTQAPIRASLLAKFVLKGAFLATSFAFVLQMALLFFFAFVLSITPFAARHVDRAEKMSELPLPKFIASCIFEGAMAGFSEEASKLLVALMCVEALPPGAPLYGSLLRYRHCPGCRCRDLLESPSAFVLSAVATGLGFMVVENMVYATGEAVTPGHSGDPDAIFWIGMARVCFNLHWVLTGLSAVRFLPHLFSEPEGQATCNLRTPLAFAAAVWPSGCFHAIWDIVVMSFGYKGPSGGEEDHDEDKDENADWRTVLQVLFMLAAIPALVAYFSFLARGLWKRWPSDDDYGVVQNGLDESSEESCADRAP